MFDLVPFRILEDGLRQDRKYSYYKNEIAYMEKKTRHNISFSMGMQYCIIFCFLRW